MSIDLLKSKIETLKELTKKLASESPEDFDMTIAVTDNRTIYSEFPEIFGLEEFSQKQMKDYFERNPDNDGAAIPIKIANGKRILNSNRSTLHIFGTKETSLLKDNGEEYIFDFCHEAMHASKNKLKINKRTVHRHEVFADVGAYLLYLREVGKDNFIDEIPFTKTLHLVTSNPYKVIGAYYTTEALLAAQHIAEKINVKQLSFKQIKTISTTIEKEFSFSNKKLKYLYNNLSEEDSALEKAIVTKNKEIYIAFRPFSLRKTFKDAAQDMAEDIENFLKKKDAEMNITLDPIERKISEGKKSNTNLVVNKLITQNQHLAI